MGILKWGKYAQKGLPSPPKPSPPKKSPKPKEAPPRKPPKPKPVKPAVSAREVERRYRNAMAAKIQRATRAVLFGHPDVRNELQGQAPRLHAVVLRRRKLRRFARAFAAALRMQTVVREWIRRRRAAEEAQRAAATHLQASARRWLATRAFVAMREAARRAAAEREAAERDAADRERRSKAVRSIQLVYRMVHFRRSVATIRLQRAFRSHLCRRLLKSLREVSRLKALTR
jgi:hypothetical protein